MSFGTVAIYGVGLLGGSLGMALRSKGACDAVVGVGRNPDRLATARDSGAVDRFTTNVEVAVADADIIVLCTPVAQIIQDLPWVLANARDNAVVTDVGSVKQLIVDAAGHARRFIGSHPMAGSEQTGVEAARPDLFENATWVITPSERTDIHVADIVTGLAETVGAHVLPLSPEAHDRAVALTSHLPHVLASALIRFAVRRTKDMATLPQLSAGSFADATRVAASSPLIWRDICVANRVPISHALREYAAELEDAANIIETADEATIEQFFSEAAEDKRLWRRHGN
jgi:prephenate dehydrogenase